MRSLWKGLTPFATHLTLKYALRMGTNAFYQSLLRDKVPPGPSLRWRGLLLCRALLALAGTVSARPALRVAKHTCGAHRRTTAHKFPGHPAHVQRVTGCTASACACTTCIIAGTGHAAKVALFSAGPWNNNLTSAGFLPGMVYSGL